MSAPTLQSRVRGCLLGGAIGDALGAPLEFLSGDVIRERHGEHIATFIGHTGRPIGAITDDTQMTLFTAEGLIRADVAASMGEAGSLERIVHHAHLRWLATQGHRLERVATGLDSGWLIGERWLHSRRAPGNTCLSALLDTEKLGSFADNDSKGCGGVMRVAPVGLIARDAPTAFIVGAACAALTHGHPSGTLSSAHLAATICSLRDGHTLDEALDVADELLAAHEEGGEVIDAVAHARRLARGGPASSSVVELGEGWVAEEALAIAIYCSLVADDYVQAVSLAVVHSGDSDSTGAITGNIVGTLWGEDALPAELRRDVEGAATITRLADDLHDGPLMGTTSTEILSRDYPGF